MHHVPYVSESGEVRYGILISELQLAGDRTAPPNSHTVSFVGGLPYTDAGQSLESRLVAGREHQIDENLTASFIFSRVVPERRYRDYHHKMTTYERFLSRYAKRIDPNVSAQTFEVSEGMDEDSPFAYTDTASSRAGILSVTSKLKMDKVAIVGLGGTGSYILDQLAKTPVREIHLYDGDTFGQHNAFRAPGAPSIEALTTRLQKSEYFKSVYSQMHSGIHAHGHIEEANFEQLRTANFVFIAVDSVEARAFVVPKLREYGVPFIDVGMGIQMDQDSARLFGVLKVVLSTQESESKADTALLTSGVDAEDLYSQNIQVADLNMMNAALAVIKWKKFMGFYADLRNECVISYQTTGNSLSNEGL